MWWAKLWTAQEARAATHRWRGTAYFKLESAQLLPRVFFCKIQTFCGVSALSAPGTASCAGGLRDSPIPRAGTAEGQYCVATPVRILALPPWPVKRAECAQRQGPREVHCPVVYVLWGLTVVAAGAGPGANIASAVSKICLRCVTAWKPNDDHDFAFVFRRPSPHLSD